jgi:hypothetical protein
MAAKKPAPKKNSAKKPGLKKKAVAKAAKKAIKSKKVPKAKPLGDEAPPTGDCMCRQKRPNGKFYAFSLVQGRWIQSSAVPFPTKELCEEVNC